MIAYLFRQNFGDDSVLLARASKKDPAEIGEWIKKTLPDPGSNCAKRGLSIEGLSEESIVDCGIRQDKLIKVDWKDGNDYSFIGKFLEQIEKIEIIVIESRPGLRVGSTTSVLVLF